MSWIDTIAPYLHVVGLGAMGVALVLAWRAGRRPHLRGLIRFHPLWKQREDFSAVAWWLWIGGLIVVVVYLVLRFVGPRAG
jgi:hypothetical protein